MATDRPDGTTMATLSADGSTLWWFDDHDGDEFGSWRAQPFGTGPTTSATPPPTDASSACRYTTVDGPPSTDRWIREPSSSANPASTTPRPTSSPAG